MFSTTPTKIRHEYLILLGPRQTGKTTLIKTLIKPDAIFSFVKIALLEAHLKTCLSITPTIENALIKLAQQLNNRINRKVNIMAKEAGVDGDLVLKRETERITSIVIKDASIKGYKVHKTKMAPLSNGKFTTFILKSEQLPSSCSACSR